MKPPYQPPNDKMVGEKEIEEIAKKEIYFFAEYKVFILNFINLNFLTEKVKSLIFHQNLLFYGLSKTMNF